MTKSNINTNVIFAIGIVGIFTIPSISSYFAKKHAAEIDLKKAELEASYPPEYWLSKQAIAEAEAEINRAKIESDERLALDSRNRKDAEKAALREFEKNAPAEYWEQKRIESEEQTKRELNKQRYNSEQVIAKQHQQAIEQGLRATERVLLSNNTSFSI